MMVAALNPCPCGYRNDPRRSCQCSAPQIERYMSKISGPLLDRIDLHVEVASVPFQELASKQTGSDSEQMRAAVLEAETVQDRRFGVSRGRRNSQMSSREIRRFCPLDQASQELLKSSVHELGLSARAHDKVLRVARTIADLDNAESIQEAHLGEAINYRLLDRQIWS